MHPSAFQRLRDASLDPITLPIADAIPYSGLSRSEIYRQLANGNLYAIKSGSRTLILVESIRAYLSSLPAATFRPAKAA